MVIIALESPSNQLLPNVRPRSLWLYHVVENPSQVFGHALIRRIERSCGIHHGIRGFFDGVVEQV
jgi:hypothetical protein